MYAPLHRHHDDRAGPIAPDDQEWVAKISAYNSSRPVTQSSHVGRSGTSGVGDPATLARTLASTAGSVEGGTAVARPCDASSVRPVVAATTTFRPRANASITATGFAS